jgi:SSS family solute:Na+ symporter
MRLHVTSAYEILEARLGLSVRMLGSSFFLLMRLFWMAVIIYTTATQVLVPVAGLDPAYAPYVSALLGFITVIYTSMGGFKAVVFTDVVQTLILFGGALLTVLAVTAEFGGLGWFPSRWEPSWERPVLFYDANVRVTFFSGVMALAVWHICTAGSDQMAIQRYLATRDVKSARRMFTTALSANMLVGLFLGALGLALFAYFRARPEMMNLGQNLRENSDQLFSQFIVFALPEGISGLVVAGLLAAAMSSLSSGVSSSSSVITVDFIERFGHASAGDRMSARTAQIVSWLIGAAVVALSTGVGVVEGNLLEVTFKVVNLLTAPLFGLFFMAMFVRFATPFGTWVGAVAGVTAIVLVNFWKELTGQAGISFMWGMPLSLAVQIAAGCLASLSPIGAARPMLAADAPTAAPIIAEEGAAM